MEAVAINKSFQFSLSMMGCKRLTLIENIVTSSIW